MLGLSGRGAGLVVRLLPKFVRNKRPEQMPPTVEAAALLSGAVPSGHVAAEIELNDYGKPQLVLPIELRDLVDASAVRVDVDFAWDEGRTEGVVELVPVIAQHGGNFRVAPAQALQRLEATSALFWKRTGYYFESYRGKDQAGYLELVVRWLLWAVWVLLIVGALSYVLTQPNLFQGTSSSEGGDGPI